MKKMNKSKEISLAGLFVALGVLLPFVTAHAFGMSGTIFTPMHIPIFLLGFICGPIYGAISGLLVPLLSYALTGMPPLYPMLPVMMGELLVYGCVSGFLYRNMKWSIYPSLLLAMVCGRIVNGSIFALLFFIYGTPFTLESILAGFVTGIPGVVIQLIVVAPIVKVIRRITDTASVTKEEKADYLIREAVGKIHREEYSCIVIKDGKIVCRKTGNGVTPILEILDTEKELLDGAVVVDKIIGKAAAMLLKLGKASEVHGLLVSKSAEKYLTKNGIEISYERCIDVINNRTGDGICPLERSVMDIDDEKEAYVILKETIIKLRKLM